MEVKITAIVDHFQWLIGCRLLLVVHDADVNASSGARQPISDALKALLLPLCERSPLLHTFL